MPCNSPFACRPRCTRAFFVWQYSRALYCQRPKLATSTASPVVIKIAHVSGWWWLISNEIEASLRPEPFGDWRPRNCDPGKGWCVETGQRWVFRILHEHRTRIDRIGPWAKVRETVKPLGSGPNRRQ